MGLHKLLLLTSSLTLISCYPVHRNEIMSAQPTVAPTCPENWALFGPTKQCYRFYNSTPKNWTQARHTSCQKVGAELVSITNQVENNFVTQLTNGNEAWTGLNDPNKSDQWVWSDGHQLNFTKWAPGEPDKPFPQQCGAINFGNSEGLWVSYQCEELMNYMCKKNMTSNSDQNNLSNHTSSFIEWARASVDFIIKSFLQLAYI